MPQDHLNALPQGSRIEEYEIVRVLGAGGFGITYLAFDHKLDGPVALKEYFPSRHAVRTDDRRVVASTTDNHEVFTWGLERFAKEARTIHSFRHPNVVRVHRLLELKGTAYIVMEYVEGESLATILEARGRLSASEWRPWLDHLMDGLAHVHGYGYVHRDIKPANIVIRIADDEPVLIDFGAARVAAQERTHTKVLTPEYAPIEQYSSHAAEGPPTDIFALAAVSYRVLTGELPPNAPDRMLNDLYVPLAERVANADAQQQSSLFGIDATVLDRPWLAMIDQGLQLRPDARPQSVAAWRAITRSPSVELDQSPEALNLAKIATPKAATSVQPDPRTLALTQLQRAAENGSAEAQVALGKLYVAGRVVEANHTTAVAWFQKAADHGDAEAQCLVGMAYEDGRGVHADQAIAKAWYRKAAEQGYAAAQYCLGVVYAVGQGGTVDLRKAVRLFHQAAEQGSPEAQYALGGMYERGKGLTKNLAEALVWYEKAANLGLTSAQLLLGNMYAEGRGVDIDFARATAWYRRAASKGDAVAQHNLGDMYDRGDGVQVNAETAAAWYRRAAKQGHAPSQFNLGIMYALGEGVPADAATAAAWYRRAADQGHAQAQFNLGNMHLRGEGVPEDLEQAAVWHRRAAEQGLADAQYTLGISYAQGEGVPRDPVQAAVWFRQAAEQGHAGAQQYIPGTRGPFPDLDEVE